MSWQISLPADTGHRHYLGWACAFWPALIRLSAIIIHLLRTQIGFHRQTEGEEESPPLARLVRRLLYRLALVPPAIALSLLVFVYNATHPAARPAPASPASLGIYCDRVVVVADDGVRSETWLAPVLEARDILQMRDSVLHRHSPVRGTGARSGDGW